MKENRNSVAERIRQRARQLFYEQGYSQTGINQIISEAGVARASFYKHFPSKGDLARSYLGDFHREMISTLKRLMDRSCDIHDFLARWTALLLRDAARRRLFRGCAVANFIAEGLEEREQFLTETRGIIETWQELFREFLAAARDRGELPQDLDPDLAARRMLSVYEGHLALWNMTGDPRYLLDIESELRRAVMLRV